jgi:hypothetical protein
MSVRVSCPYCNTSFTLPAVPASGRTPCARCGDVFPIRDFTEVGSDLPPPAPTPTRRARAKWSVQRSVMVAAAMGLVGVGVGLFLYYRTGPRPTPEPDPPAVVAATAPATLAGVGFIPADANVLLAVQPQPVLAYADRTKQDPRALLAKAGVPGEFFATLDQLGVTLPMIDHVVIGAKVADDAAIRVAVALVLRRPLGDEDKFLAALKAQQAPKGRWNVQLAGLPLLLAKASPRVWVFGWDEKDLAPSEKGGLGVGAKHLSADLQDALTQRLPPDAAVWLATASENWAKKGSVQLLVGEVMKKREWLQLMAKGQAAVAGLSFDEPPRARLFVRAADADTGAKLRDHFKGKATGDDVRHGGAGEWALFDAPFDPANGLAALRGLLE